MEEQNFPQKSFAQAWKSFKFMDKIFKTDVLILPQLK